MDIGAERRVGIREFKLRLSDWVRAVRQGATVVVTHRGRPVARLVPEGESFEDRMAALRSAGVVHWNGRRLGEAKPVARARGSRSVAEIVVEDRR